MKKENENLTLESKYGIGVTFIYLWKIPGGAQPVTAICYIPGLLVTC